MRWLHERWVANHKKIWRQYSLAGLGTRRRKRKRIAVVRDPLIDLVYKRKHRAGTCGQVLDACAYEAGVMLSFIRPGKSVEKAYIDTFNGKFRDPTCRCLKPAQERFLAHRCHFGQVGYRWIPTLWLVGMAPMRRRALPEIASGFMSVPWQRLDELLQLLCIELRHAGGAVAARLVAGRDQQHARVG